MLRNFNQYPTTFFNGLSCCFNAMPVVFCLWFMLTRLLVIFLFTNVCKASIDLPDYCDKSRRKSPLLWRIKRNPPAYFFGTIHVPYSDVWRFIDPLTKSLFRRSDVIFFELDLGNPATLQTLALCQLLPEGDVLANHVPTLLFARLKRHFDYIRKGLIEWMKSEESNAAQHLFDSIAATWERKRPVWIMLLLQTLTRADLSSRGVPVLDLHLAQEAELLSKPSGAIENVEEQCASLNALNSTQIVFALEQTLAWHERLRSDSSLGTSATKDLVKHYNCGDLDAVIFNKDTYKLPELSVSSDVSKQAEATDDYFRRELIQKRNVRMAERVARLLASHSDKSFFFAFGAGHFLGTASVIDLLRRKYEMKIEPVIFDSSKRQRKYRKSKRIRSRSKQHVSSWSVADNHSFNHQQQQYSTSSSEWTGKFDRWPSLRNMATSATGNKQEPKSAANSEKEQRRFNELWVRIKGISPKFCPFFGHGKRWMVLQRSDPSRTPLRCSLAAIKATISTTIPISTFRSHLLRTKPLHYESSLNAD